MTGFVESSVGLPRTRRGPLCDNPCVSSPVTLGLSAPTFLQSLGCVLSSHPPPSQPRTGVFSFDDIWNLLIVVTLAYICIPYANQGIYF